MYTEDISVVLSRFNERIVRPCFHAIRGGKEAAK